MTQQTTDLSSETLPETFTLTLDFGRYHRVLEIDKRGAKLYLRSEKHRGDVLDYEDIPAQDGLEDFVATLDPLIEDLQDLVHEYVSVLAPSK